MKKAPDAFRTISEVAEWLDLPPHVLRFWESKFSQVKPVKRAGGRRYYRPTDMLLLGGLKQLLHEEGMTIRAVQGLLREKGAKHVCGFSKPLDDGNEPIASKPAPRIVRETPAKGIPPISQATTTPVDEPETSEEPALPFIHRPSKPTDAPAERPFLRAASETLDTVKGPPSDDILAPPPEVSQTLQPVGPVRTDQLREALMAAGGLDKDLLSDVFQRLTDLSARMESRPSKVEKT